MLVAIATMLFSVVALEARDDPAKHAERKVQRDVTAMISRIHCARSRACSGVILNRCSRLKAISDHDQVGDHADRREHEEQRAGDLVERARVAVRAVLRHELDQRAAVAEIEHREIRR